MHHVRSTLRAVVITVLGGWLIAVLMAGVFALFQYWEVAQTFPAAQVATEFQSRIDRELWRGSLLLYVQAGVLCGVLWWAVQQYHAHGLLAGVLVAATQLVIGGQLGASLLLMLPTALVIVATGALAGNRATTSITSPSLDTSPADAPRL